MLTEKQAIRLFGDCLDNRISEEDGAELLQYLEDHPKFTRDIHDDLYIDNLLRQRKAEETEDGENRPNPSKNAPEDDLFQWIDDLNRLAVSNSTPTNPLRSIPSKTDGKARSAFGFRSVSALKFLYHGVHRVISQRGRIFFLGGFILFLLIGVYGFYHEFLNGGTAPTVAHLTGFDEAVWETGETPVELGDPIKKKPLRIRSGSISLKTLNGADVILEGPAELRFDSQTNWQLSSGYLSANVPPQNRKLCIKTAQMSIDVLGTEFWVKATEEKSEVHLIRGKLNLQGASIKSQILNAGDAFSISAVGETKLFKALESQLLKAEALFARAEQKLRIRREKTLQAVNREPSLLVYFDFQEFGRTLPNLAAHGKPLLNAARIEGCSQISGTSTSEKAVAFRRKSDCMRLELSKLLESFTLFVRIRVDADVKHRCALLISEESVAGSLQWMIAGGGVPVLNICKDANSVFENFTAPKIFSGSNLRSWKALAVVYDASARKVDWYLDGKVIASKEIKEPVAVVLNRGMIGNWTSQNELIAPGAGFGLSEFRLYERPLTEREILDLNTSERQ